MLCLRVLIGRGLHKPHVSGGPKVKCCVEGIEGQWPAHTTCAPARLAPAFLARPPTLVLAPLLPRLHADFTAVYASGIAGIAGPSPDELADDLEPLFDAIVREVSPPKVQVWQQEDSCFVRGVCRLETCRSGNV